jgi:hypothetical protein
MAQPADGRLGLAGSDDLSAAPGGGPRQRDRGGGVSRAARQAPAPRPRHAAGPAGDRGKGADTAPRSERSLSAHCERPRLGPRRARCGRVPRVTARSDFDATLNVAFRGGCRESSPRIVDVRDRVSGSAARGGGAAVQAVVAARRWLWSLRRLWVAAISRHSDRQADRPRRWKRLITRLNFSWPNTGSMVTCRVR